MLIQELFKKQVLKTPSKKAVIDENDSLTFDQLDTQSDILCNYLRISGITVNTPVGIFLEKSVTFIIAYLAVLKAGGTCTVIDIKYPEVMLKMVLENAKPLLILTNADLSSNLIHIDSHISIIELSKEWYNKQQMCISPMKEPQLQQPDNTAFIIYSSGTTGVPKGILCPHRAAVFSYCWRHRHYPYGDDDREACNVFFIWEMLRPITQGITMYIIPDSVITSPKRIANFICENKITRMLFTPSLLLTVLQDSSIDFSDKFKTMRQAWLCGEVVTVSLLSLTVQTIPWVTILNLYSVSECHDIATSNLSAFYKHGDTSNRKFAPVGKINEEVSVYIMDSEMRSQPIGVPGEIYVGGPGLAVGYLNRPEVTAEKFIEDTKYGRLYRSGDWGYLYADGNLEICGRCDSMVKIRGYSIEIHAVETAVTELNYVDGCCVVVQGDEGEEKFIVCYVVLKYKHKVALIREDLKKKLPFYMIPSYFVQMTSLPLLPTSGKLDKKALPSIMEANESCAGVAHPVTATEKNIYPIWLNILNCKNIDIYDSFFDIGGHSLMAVRLVSALSDKFDVEIEPEILYKYQSLHIFSAYIEWLIGDMAGSPPQIEKFDLQQEIINFKQSSVKLDMQLRAFWRSCQYGNRWNRGRILLTGATGFFGAFILRSLLLKTQSIIYCLVRADEKQSVYERLQNVLKKYNIIPVSDSGKDQSSSLVIKKSFHDRVHVVKGDITLTNMGMSDDDYCHLSYEIDFVIHAAAVVNMLYNYETLRTSNVIATRNILLFAAENKIKPLQYISTNAVFPHSLRDCSEETDISVYSDQLSDGYSQSKWVAEQLIQNAISLGIPATIFRMGNLFAAKDDGVWNDKDFTYHILKACIVTQVAPDIEWEIEGTPVDFAADIVISISGDMTTIGQTYHIINSNTLNFKVAIDRLRFLGYQLKTVCFKEWKKSILQSQELSTVKGLLNSWIYGDNFFGSFSTFKNERVIEYMFPETYPVIDQILFDLYINQLISNHQLPSPPKINFTKRSLDGIVAIVTGSSSGIGRAIALQLSLEGAKVVLVARREQKLKELVHLIETNGGLAIYVLADVVCRDQMKQMMARTNFVFGRIDVLVNCAGVMYYTYMKNMKEDEWERQIDINCKGVVNGVGAVLPSMLHNGSGHIINISSDAGKKAFAGLAVYSGTKYFVEGFSEALRQEVAGSGIKVTTILPGDVHSELLSHSTDVEAKSDCDMSKKHQILSPENIAQAVVYALTQPKHCAVNSILIEPREAPI